MALLSGRGEAVGRRGDCGWLSRDWSMALLSGTGDAVARGGGLWLVIERLVHDVVVRNG